MFRMLAGFIEYKSGDLDKAEIELSLAVQLEPDLWRAHYYLSLVHETRGFDRAAATELTTAIAHGPRYSLPYRALVALYSRWGYDAEAVAVAQLAIDVLPNEIDLHHDLGRALVLAGDDKAAIKAFTQLLKVSQNDPRGLYERGCAHARLKQKKQAKSDLESFLVVAPATQQSEIAAATDLLDALE
jgi:tetratricopeptide (TPR) repeat protein